MNEGSCNKYLKYSLVNSLSIFSLLQYLYTGILYSVPSEYSGTQREHYTVYQYKNIEIKKKYLERSPMNISNTYCKKPYLLVFSSIIACSLKKAFRCLHNIPL